MPVPRKNEKIAIFLKKRGTGEEIYEAIPRQKFWRGTESKEIIVVPRLQFLALKDMTILKKFMMIRMKMA